MWGCLPSCVGGTVVRHEKLPPNAHAEGHISQIQQGKVGSEISCRRRLGLVAIANVTTVSFNANNMSPNECRGPACSTGWRTS